jgi:type I site-specific restriction endonuclease
MTDHFANDGKPMPTLALADALIADDARSTRWEAADELRRLHAEVELQKALVAEAQEMAAKVCAENEELRYDREELRKIAEILEAQERFLGGWHSIVRQAFARIDSDEALLKQALDALDCIYSPLHVREINKVAAAIAALQERLK